MQDSIPKSGNSSIVCLIDFRVVSIEEDTYSPVVLPHTSSLWQSFNTGNTVCAFSFLSFHFETEKGFESINIYPLFIIVDYFTLYLSEGLYLVMSFKLFIFLSFISFSPPPCVCVRLNMSKSLTLISRLWLLLLYLQAMTSFFLFNKVIARIWHMSDRLQSWPSPYRKWCFPFVCYIKSKPEILHTEEMIFEFLVYTLYILKITYFEVCIFFIGFSCFVSLLCFSKAPAI